MGVHACYEVSCISCILYIQNMCFWAFLRQKTDKIGQFKKIGGEKGRKSVNYLKIKEEVICRNSPNKKKGEKVSDLEKFRKRLFVPTKKKENGEKLSILEKFRKRLFVGTVL